MKTKKYILFMIMFLVIGSAAVSTSLFLNGIIGIAANDDFDVIFTSAISESGGNATILDNGKSITYNTRDLTIVNEEARLDFVVKNISTQYDADAELKCVLNNNDEKLREYISYDYEPKSKFNLRAQESKNGNVIIKLTKAYAGDDQSLSFTCTLVSNAVEKDSPVVEEAHKNYSIYSWEDIPLLNSNIGKTVDFLREKNVTDVYHSFDANNLNDDATKARISYLRANDFNVYFLMGHPNFYHSKQEIEKRIDCVFQYNSSVNEEDKIKGIVLDIEPYIDDEFKSNIVNGMEVYANTVEEVYAYAKGKNLDVVNVIPYWYDASYLDSHDYSSEDRKVIEASLRKIFTNSDRISVMNYYKTNMVEGIRYEVSLANELGIEIESIAEFGRPNGDSIPNTVTMWVEENPFTYADQKWEEVNNEYTSINGFSYHDLSSMLSLEKSYKEYIVELIDSDGNTLADDDVMVEFLDGSYYTFSSDKDVSLPIGKEASFSAYGYKVMDSQKNEIDEYYGKITLTLEVFDKYTLEIYPKLFNGTKYVGMTSGKIILRNDKFNKVIEKEITDQEFVIMNVYSDTKYDVEVLDDAGNAYTFEYANAKNERGEKKTISSSNKILIPKGFKSNLYLGPSFYVK